VVIEYILLPEQLERESHEKYQVRRIAAVDHVEAEQRRDPVPVAVDGQPLKPIGLGRIRDEQQRADLTTAHSCLDSG
jgi:hypothetical protein